MPPSCPGQSDVRAASLLGTGPPRIFVRMLSRPGTQLSRPRVMPSGSYTSTGGWVWSRVRGGGYDIFCGAKPAQVIAIASAGLLLPYRLRMAPVNPFPFTAFGKLPVTAKGNAYMMILQTVSAEHVCRHGGGVYRRGYGRHPGGSVYLMSYHGLHLCSTLSIVA